MFLIIHNRRRNLHIHDAHLKYILVMFGNMNSRINENCLETWIAD